MGINGGSERPPNIEDFARKAQSKLGSAMGGWRKWGRWALLVIVLIIAAATSYYQVEPDEVGVVTRFGAYVHKAEPGAHFKIPFWVESVTKVPVQRQLKQEFGFRTTKADVQTQYAEPPEAKNEATMLTGDLNVANVQWIIQYRIADPYKYLFKVRHVRDTLRDMSEASMRQVVGDSSVNEVLTIGRERIQVDAKLALQQLCDQYATGIHVEQLILQDVNPPKPVRPSFNEVNEANQMRERLINEARGEYNRVIPEARGKAKQSIRNAEGYATRRVNHAQGDTKRFLALQAEYAQAPRVTRTRLHLETLGRVLPQSKKRIVVDSEIEGLVPLLSLGEQTRVARTTAGGGGGDK